MHIRAFFTMVALLGTKQQHLLNRIEFICLLEHICARVGRLNGRPSLAIEQLCARALL